MINNYEHFKLEYRLDQYFEGNLTLEELYLDETLSVVNEGIKDFLTSKLGTLLKKASEWSLKIEKQGMKLLKKLFDFLWKILKAMGNWCNKHKNICALIILMIIMITVGAVSTYASTNPGDPNIPEIANAAIGYLEKISSTLIQDGVSEGNINMAKSILTEMKNGSSSVNYGHISKESQVLAESAMKIVKQIKNDDPDMFSDLVDTGSKIISQFSVNINGLVTVIGK